MSRWAGYGTGIAVAVALTVVGAQAQGAQHGATDKTTSSRAGAQKDAGAQASAQKDQRETFTAVLVNPNNPNAAASATPIQITINRWSTDAERDKLFTALREQSNDDKALLKTVESLPRVGSLSVTGSTGYDAHFARRTRTPSGGEKITVLTDRPMSFAERYDAGRSTDYPFTVISLDVGTNGQGTGSMTFATKISMDQDTGTIVLENYSVSPITLSGVRRLK